MPKLARNLSRGLVYEAEADEGGYWATVPELPGCGTSGGTIEEIELSIRNAIET